jgi:hypothetical protein
LTAKKIFFAAGAKFCISFMQGPLQLVWRKSMHTALYALGYLLLVVVVSWLAYLSHIPESYIAAMIVIMLGIGVVSGLENARQKDSNY